ncbi:hypothetical protein L1987_36966 [Smallanthus sonchifolius]|uniref:Uncharacterized protein n=1 Tax=Smallanthus sonchifolius TaxID=185202 RepID=A0ACB9HGE0_9ASTR|nr:hypothetical protein L1987_36966 [Smallanthus sonchifolius]
MDHDAFISEHSGGTSVKAESYKVGIDEVRRSGFIEVGDLYAEEERDFLVAIDILVEESSDFSIHACDSCLHTYRTCFPQSERSAALATILAARKRIKDNCNSNGEVGIEQTTATLKMQVLQWEVESWAGSRACFTAFITINTYILG